MIVIAKALLQGKINNFLTISFAPPLRAGVPIVYKSFLNRLDKHSLLVSPKQSTMSGDAAGLIENKASGLDPWPVLLAEISMFLVFATTSKAKMMKVRLFDIF